MSPHLTYLEAVVTGLVQGVTELFPVSSLGHNVLLPALVGGSWASALNVSAPGSPYLAFIVGLHVATAIAMIAYFWRDWLRIIRGFFSSLRTRSITTPDERLAWMIILATIPVGIAGVALQRVFTNVFAKPELTAVFLALNGVVLLASERMRRTREAVDRAAVSAAAAGAPAGAAGWPAGAAAPGSAGRGGQPAGGTGWGDGPGLPTGPSAGGWPGGGPGGGRPADEPGPQGYSQQPWQGPDARGPRGKRPAGRHAHAAGRGPWDVAGRAPGGRTGDGVAADPGVAADRRLSTIGYKRAVIVGATQILALLPGISRDGIVTVGGMWRGLRREDAVRFSFLLSAPVILAAGVLKVHDLTGPTAKGIHGPVLVGSLLAAVAAFLSVRFLTKYFSEDRSLTPFGVYCLVAGLGSLAYLALK